MQSMQINISVRQHDALGLALVLLV